MRQHLVLLVVLRLILAPICEAQQQPQAEKKLGWVDAWREATVAIGRIAKADVTGPNGIIIKKEVFIPVGTGLIAALPNDTSGIPWLMTAKHVFYEPSENWDPDSIQLRFSWFDGKPVDEYLGVTVALKKSGQRLWITHPSEEVDLACIQLRLSSKDIGRENVSAVQLLRVQMNIFKARLYSYWATREQLGQTSGLEHLRDKVWLHGLLRASPKHIHSWSIAMFSRETAADPCLGLRWVQIASGISAGGGKPC
jgi:hypothetical protein